jgi:hypothetical protein
MDKVVTRQGGHLKLGKKTTAEDGGMEKLHYEIQYLR